MTKRLRSRLRSGVGHLAAEVWRMRWPLLLTAGIGLARHWGLVGRGDVSLLLHKVSLLTLGVVLAHVVRQQMLPYIDLGDLLERRHPGFGPAFLGVMLFYAAVILALGLAL